MSWPSSTTILTIKKDSSKEHPLALGILLLRLMDPADKTSSGIWTKHAITPDHEREKYEAMVVPMGALRVGGDHGRSCLARACLGLMTRRRGWGWVGNC
jgi:hypothetical protein